MALLEACLEFSGLYDIWGSLFGVLATVIQVGCFEVGSFSTLPMRLLRDAFGLPPLVSCP